MTKRLPEKLLTYARSMRHIPSPIENALWHRLRNRQLGGLKFRRQFVIETFIADFACPDIMLIIELDGETHAGQEEYDATRTAALERIGFRILRFSNAAVARNIESVLATILAVAGNKLSITEAMHT